MSLIAGRVQLLRDYAVRVTRGSITSLRNLQRISSIMLPKPRGHKAASVRALGAEVELFHFGGGRMGLDLDWRDRRTLASSLALDRLSIYMKNRAVRLAQYIQGLREETMEKGSRVMMTDEVIKQLDDLGLKPFRGFGIVSSKVMSDNPFVRIEWEDGRSTLIAKNALKEAPIENQAS